MLIIDNEKDTHMVTYEASLHANPVIEGCIENLILGSCRKWQLVSMLTGDASG
jgi:hypothetical protein